MTNGEKFKTTEERSAAFNVYCHKQSCSNCELDKLNKRQGTYCMFRWLELEYKEKLKPCPFCGGKAMERKSNRFYYVFCTNCHVKTVDSITQDGAIATWNRRTSNE